MRKFYFVEMQIKDQCVMVSRDFNTPQEAEEWAEGIDTPDECELWIMSIEYDENGEPIVENYVKRLKEPPQLDPCNYCNKPICYGCPYTEEN